jgi:hypothetical protein
MDSIYKVTFKKSSFELAEYYDNLSEIDKERISDLQATAFFDFDDDKDNYQFFIIIDGVEFKPYKRILDENLIEHQIENVSQKILTSNFDAEKYINKFVNPMNSIRFSSFVEDLNDWIYKNLDIDMVLDRISEVGFTSLRKIEKDFLENYSTN